MQNIMQIQVFVLHCAADTIGRLDNWIKEQVYMCCWVYASVIRSELELNFLTFIQKL